MAEKKGGKKKFSHPVKGLFREINGFDPPQKRRKRKKELGEKSIEFAVRDTEDTLKV